MDGEMVLTPEELAGLTPEELAELRQVYAESAEPLPGMVGSAVTSSSLAR